VKRIALVGMPNTGKSTFFNRVTGASARVGNWPGITVELFAARVLLGGSMIELVDLPGVYDLDGEADDERVVREFLANTRVDLVAVIVANGETAPTYLVEQANARHVPLFTSAQPSPHLVDVFRLYLSRVLAEVTTLHGVFLDVLEMGVLITGASAIGKSELALELISRGNGLIADDIVEIFRISPDTLEGRCPGVLRDFLEVRGIGILNIRTIFGETAVRPRKLLRFIVHLEDHSHDSFSELDRLQVNATYQEILGVPVRKVTIPVAAGRNLAVLVEAAVRNFVLNQRGIDSTKEFIERQQKLMDDGG
jgi:HPr kinase/phosphorylase